METKKCSKCGELRPIENFEIRTYTDKNGNITTFLRSECKMCKKEYNRNLRLSNIKERKEKDRIYHEKNKEKRSEYNRNYRKQKFLENPEFYKEKYYKHRERQLAQKKEHYKNNKEKMLLKNKKWREGKVEYIKNKGHEYWIEVKNNPEKYENYILTKRKYRIKNLIHDKERFKNWRNNNIAHINGESYTLNTCPEDIKPAVEAAIILKNIEIKIKKIKNGESL